MGSNLIYHTRFLEFYGLPGSGKSTISHMLADELKKHGKSVHEPTYDLDHRYSSSIRMSIKFIKLIRYAIICPKKCKKLFTLIRSNGYSGFNALSQAANIAPKLWVYDHARVDFVIFDEGLSQSAISLGFNDKKSSENENSLYELCKRRQIVKFYIKVSVETTLLRLSERDKHDSRIEKIKEKDERILALSTFEALCNDITSGYVIEEDNIQSALSCIINKVI